MLGTNHGSYQHTIQHSVTILLVSERIYYIGKHFKRFCNSDKGFSIFMFLENHIGKGYLLFLCFPAQ